MNLRNLARSFKAELAFYRRLAMHPQTPKVAKRLLGLAIGYALLPFDLIPDFVPLIGHLDDAVIVPGLIYLALKRVPDAVKAECRAAECRAAECRAQVEALDEKVP